MGVVAERIEVSTLRNRVSLRYVAAGLAFISELIHLWILPGEFITWVLHGLVFLVVAVGQGVLVVKLLFNPGRWTLRLGIVLNVGIVFIWAVTRLESGVIPAWIVAVQLPIAGLDLVALAVELVLVMLLIRLQRTHGRKTQLHESGERHD